MGKWLSNIIAALVILAATSLAGALLKGPIDELANQDRLKAQVQLSPWISKPEFSKNGAGEKIRDGSTPDIKAELASPVASSLFDLARVSIENNGTKTVKNINFRMESIGESEAIVEGEKYFQTYPNANKILIPDMKPGDRFSVYIWGKFTTYSIEDDFKSYSSEGSFLTTLDWPQSQDFQYGSWISQSLDEYAWPTFVITLVILAFGFGILLATLQEYIKTILIHKKAYKIERRRFLEDPKKFSPDIELTSQRHYQAHALFSGRAEKSEQEKASPDLVEVVANDSRHPPEAPSD